MLSPFAFGAAMIRASGALWVSQVRVAQVLAAAAAHQALAAARMKRPDKRPCVAPAPVAARPRAAPRAPSRVVAFPPAPPRAPRDATLSR